MIKSKFLFLHLVTIPLVSFYFCLPVLSSDLGMCKQAIQIPQMPQQDKQLLYNGRVWRSLYYNVRGDEFLFSKDYLKGTVYINGKTFNNIDIKYDIYNDEIIIMLNLGTHIQLNKEMVTGFDIIFNNIKYRFTKLTIDSLSAINYYVNVLYEGKTALYLKYKKEIKELAIENKYDEFYQKQMLYFMKDGMSYRISGKKDLLRLLKDDNLQIRAFIKQQKIKTKNNKPESFIPILDYYDSLHQ
jgi:hypothetical protein